MIHIEATGGLKKDRELAEDVMWFCMETLMPRMQTLCIELEFCKTLDQGAMGFTFMGDDEKDIFIQIDHRLSRIEGRDKLIETVAHEMVHAWQMATGRLKDKFRGGYKQLWKCKDGKYRNYHNTEYAKQPWEVEAYKMQGPLTKLFMKEMNYG